MELRLDSSSDFDFCFTGNRALQELYMSSADELFSDGKILPIDIKKKPIDQTQQNRGSESDSSDLRPSEGSEKKTLKEFLSASFDEKLSFSPAPAKQFWRFGRSSSLNFDHIRGKKLIRSLQFLYRSKSTGSAPNQKQSVQSQKRPSVPGRKTTSFSSSSSYCPYKPPLKKCGSYGDKVRLSSILNLPPPYISRVSVNLFGFGSIFCNGKFKNTKKKK